MPYGFVASPTIRSCCASFNCVMIVYSLEIDCFYSQWTQKYFHCRTKLSSLLCCCAWCTCILAPNWMFFCEQHSMLQCGCTSSSKEFEIILISQQLPSNSKHMQACFQLWLQILANNLHMNIATLHQKYKCNTDCKILNTQFGSNGV